MTSQCTGQIFTGAAPNQSSEITNIEGYRFTQEEWRKSGEGAPPSKEHGNTGIIQVGPTTIVPR